MTRVEAEKQGFIQPVWLSRVCRRWYYRETAPLSSGVPPYLVALRDRHGVCVARDGNDYYDFPFTADYGGEDQIP